MQLPLWLRHRQLRCVFHVVALLHRSSNRRFSIVVAFVLALVLVVFVIQPSIVLLLLVVVIIIIIISIHIGCWCARRQSQHGQHSR
jgi:ABC-type proline/glycine betaine transport system permease subunit